jgi:hypothetical protein
MAVAIQVAISRLATSITIAAVGECNPQYAILTPEVGRLRNIAALCRPGARLSLNFLSRTYDSRQRKSGSAQKGESE